MIRWSVAFAALALVVGIPARSLAQANPAGEPDADASAHAEAEAGADAESGADTDPRRPSSDADSDSDADADANADSDVRAASSDSASETDAGKVAVVVAGDPDDALRRAAAAIDQGLVDEGLRRPSDPGVRAALRGEPSSEADGLERVRRERRGLGFGEDDRPTLARLGRMAGADAVVVVARRDGTLRAEVFDVHAERFYRDRMDAEPVDAVVAFTARAARAAHRRAREDTEPPSESAATPAEPTTVPTAEETASAAVDEDEADEADDAPSPVRAWFRKNWAFFLAGALLIGVVTGFVIRSRRDDPGLDAVILFRPGE